MSLNIGNESSKIKIYKDEDGKYKTYIKGRELKDNGNIEDIYMSKKVQFKKDVNLKNRTVIEVIKGWNSCYRIKSDELNENGKPKYKYFDKYFISEFKILSKSIFISDSIGKSGIQSVPPIFTGVVLNIPLL